MAKRSWNVGKLRALDTTGEDPGSRNGLEAVSLKDDDLLSRPQARGRETPRDKDIFKENKKIYFATIKKKEEEETDSSI